MLYICLLHIGTIINIYRYAPKKIYALQEHSLMNLMVQMDILWPSFRLKVFFKKTIGINV